MIGLRVLIPQLMLQGVITNDIEGAAYVVELDNGDWATVEPDAMEVLH